MKGAVREGGSHSFSFEFKHQFVSLKIDWKSFVETYKTLHCTIETWLYYETKLYVFKNKRVCAVCIRKWLNI